MMTSGSTALSWSGKIVLLFGSLFLTPVTSLFTTTRFLRALSPKLRSAILPLLRPPGVFTRPDRSTQFPQKCESWFSSNRNLVRLPPFSKINIPKFRFLYTRTLLLEKSSRPCSFWERCRFIYRTAASTKRLEWVEVDVMVLSFPHPQISNTKRLAIKSFINSVFTKLITETLRFFDKYQFNKSGFLLSYLNFG